MIFKTKRLLVRKFRASDLDEYYSMQSDPKVMEYIKSPLSFEESRKELGLLITYYSDLKKFYNLWGITDPVNQRLIGLCGVYKNKHSEYEIAYRLIPETWGQGYGNEVAEGLINYCTAVFRLKSIVAYAESENIGSCKILARHMDFVEEKIFKPTGIMSKKYFLDFEKS